MPSRPPRSTTVPKRTPSSRTCRRRRDGKRVARRAPAIPADAAVRSARKFSLRGAADGAKSAAPPLIASLRASWRHRASRGAAAAAERPADETATEAVALAEALQQENAALNAQLAARRSTGAPKERLLKFYETMTGLTATPGEGSVVHCAARRGRAPPRLRPRHAAGGERAGQGREYTPTDGGTDEATARHLPEYMRDSIVFEAEQAPVFLQKVLVAVTRRVKRESAVSPSRPALLGLSVELERAPAIA